MMAYDGTTMQQPNVRRLAQDIAPMLHAPLFLYDLPWSVSGPS